MQRGLEALQRLPTGQRPADLRWRLLRRRVSALEILGRDAQYEQDLAALADELAYDARCTEAASMRCGQWLLSEDCGGLKLAARQAMALAERAGLHNFRISGMRMLADAHCGLGDWDAGARLARQALAQAQAMALHSTAANCLNTLAAVAERQQDPLGRIRCHEQALDLTRQTGDRRGEAAQLVNLSGAWPKLGDPVAARPPAEQELALAKALGARLHESVALSHAATSALWLGHADQALALALAGQALEAARAAGSAQAWQVEAQLVLGAAALALGDGRRAQQAFEQPRAMAHPAHQPRWQDASAGLGGGAASTPAVRGRRPVVKARSPALRPVPASGRSGWSIHRPRIGCHLGARQATTRWRTMPAAATRCGSKTVGRPAAVAPQHRAMR